MKKIKILRWSRVAVQVIFFLWMPALFSQAFGGMKEAAAHIGSGEMLGLSVFVVRLLILSAVTVMFGRVFCGWACAFGAVGDWLYALSVFVQNKTGKKFVKLPKRIIPFLQKLKYLVLLAILCLCFLGMSDIVTSYSPWTVFSLFAAHHFMVSSYVAATVLMGLVMVGMLIHERFFCQFLCPMGAVFSMLPETPLFRLKRKQNQCIRGCQACQNHCPVQIKLGEEPLQEGECIRCGRCMQICPKGNIRIK